METLKVPMEVRYHPAWLTWVACTTGCLNALGVECDTTDVAGTTGLAFLMNVHEGLCPSGPTAWDWKLLQRGVHHLGRSTRVFIGDEHPGPREPFRAAYEVVEAEIRAGRPCVIWGAYVPEFAIVVGVEDGKYLVKSHKECLGAPQPPIPFDALQAPGGAYVLAFPEPTAFAREHADRFAIRQALVMSRLASSRAYTTGLEAYDAWAAALEQGKADPFGNSYNVMCWAEAKRFAAGFLGRVAERCEPASEPLRRAADGYRQAADAMGRLCGLFPFPGDKGETEDPGRCAEGIRALREARAAEGPAVEALAEADAMLPG